MPNVTNKLQYLLNWMPFLLGCSGSTLEKHIKLGETLQGQVISISESQARRHCYLLGTSGSGKTELLKQILWQISSIGRGIMVVDMLDAIAPGHKSWLGAQSLGYYLQGQTPNAAYNRQVQTAYRQLLTRHDYIDLGDEDVCGYRINPLEDVFDGRSAFDRASLVADTIIRSISDKNSSANLDEMRRLSNILECGLALLSAAGGVITELPKLLESNQQQITQFIEASDNRARRLGIKIDMEEVREYLLGFFYTLKESERKIRLESTINFLGKIKRESRTKKLLSSPKSNFYFADAIKKQRTVFLRIPGGMNRSLKSNISSIFINMLQQAMEYRPKAEKEKYPYYLMIDEFHLCLDRGFPEALATTRNSNLRWFLSHQTMSQLTSNGGDSEILESIVQNCSTRIYMRVGEEDSVRIAPAVFYPMGDRLKHTYNETSTSQTHSTGRSTTRNIGIGFSQTIAESETITISSSQGHTVSFSESNGVSTAEVKSLGLTISEGEGWSKVTSKSQGISITSSEGQTVVEGIGAADGSSHSQGHTTSTGTSHNVGFGGSSGEGVSMSFNGGFQQHSLNGLGMPPVPHMGKSDHSGQSWNEGVSNSSSESNSVASAISRVISSSRSLANSTSTGMSRSQSTSVATGRSRSISRALSRSLALGITQMESFARSVGKSFSTGMAKSCGVTHSTGQNISFGKAEGENTSEAHGQTTSEKKAFYSVSEQQQIEGYELCRMPLRGAYAVIKGKEIEVHRMTTLDNPQTFETSAFGKCFVTDFLQRSRPQPPEAVKGTVFERMNEEWMLHVQPQRQES